MNNVKIYLGRNLFFAAGLMLTVQSISASTTAKNRNEVYDVLEGIRSNWTVATPDIWVNSKSAEPVVKVGEPVYFTMKSSEPAYFTLIYVDSKGYTTILDPMITETGSSKSPSDYWVFPSLANQCDVYINDPSCFDLNNIIEQAEPIGKDLVFVLASQKPLDATTLGMSPGLEMQEFGRDLIDIRSLVARVNAQATENPIAVDRYAYFVESETTEYSTRAIKRKVKELEKISAEVQPVVKPVPIAEIVEVDPEKIVTSNRPALVFSNINFAYNSSELTVPGRIELDGLGSVLVELKEEGGEYPFVELTGHTDSVGSAAYNLGLSANRAAAAKQYLVDEHGIPTDHIFTVGSGESLPLVSNANSDGRARNRRVELSVISPQ